MIEKPEPLTKEKIMTIYLENLEEKIKKDDVSLCGELKYIYIYDIKSAVQWALEEVEKEKKNYKKKQEWKDNHQEFYEGVWHGLEIARVLIKKAFEGVIEEND